MLLPARAACAASSVNGGRGGTCRASAQRSSRERRAGSGWRSRGCSARRATALTWPRGGPRSSRRPPRARRRRLRRAVARRQRRRGGRDQEGRRRPPRALRAPRRARQQRRRRRRRSRRARSQTKHLDMQLDINLRSIVLFYRECMPMLREAAARAPERARRQHRPRSRASTARRWLSVYSATKHGVVGWTEAMNKETRHARASSRPRSAPPSSTRR